MNPPAKLRDLMGCLEFDSPDYRSYFDRKRGQVVSVELSILSAFEEGREAEVSHVPNWQKEQLEIAREIVEDTGGRFLKPPDKFEFHEYRQMEEFIASLSDADAANELWRAIKGKGAFRYFRDTTTRLGLREQWQEFRDEAMRQFVIDWAKANNVAYVDDMRRRS